MNTVIKKGMRENLIPINTRPPEEQLEIRQKAQATQAKKKKERRETRDLLNDILYSEISKEELKNKVLAKGLDNNELTALLLSMVNKSSNNANMARLLFELKGDIGQQQQVNINIVNQMSDEQIADELKRLGGGGDAINITPLPPELGE